MCFLSILNGKNLNMDFLNVLPKSKVQEVILYLEAKQNTISFIESSRLVKR